MIEKLDGFRMPAEWEPQKSIWIAWPYNKKDWPDLFYFIPEVVAKIVKAISEDQKVDLLINKDKQQVLKILKFYKAKISNIRFHKIKTDRIWLRDSGPIFLINRTIKKKVILDFKFNAWAKYHNFSNDNKINNNISKVTKIRTINPKIKVGKKIRSIVMEGGAFDTNGDKSLLLTEECLLSKVQERNKGFKKKDYEDIFSRYLGINNFIWLKKGISGDDTHGHIDDIARFVSKNTIMTAVENDKKDANFKNLKQNLKILSKKRNNKKKKFKIIKIPMPTPIFIKKIRVPASYLNFLITNKKVLLPIFNVKEDKEVIKIFSNFFKNKKIIPVDCSRLIWGFGAIHCMTQQQPKF
tara:strand:- start:2513 stop:3571 length:1059 start_codon:yes stop_codon:yes gene_type:complete